MTTNTNLINAEPTKNLFINMLIRDVPLNDAISDLVDNSVDGARRDLSSSDYSGYKIEITANADRFEISDNCGGIPVDIAREYAFRFGRPANMPKTPNSIGRFGIGMKRALFKLGTKFRIESTSMTSRFVLEVDVEKWQKTKDWEFEFTEVEENLAETPRQSRGTRIIVSKLTENVSKRFRLENFITSLSQEIEYDHIYSIANGMEILINGAKLKSRQIKLLSSDEIKTAYSEETSPDGVNVRIYAGVSGPNLEEGGWYIFCNSRLVLGPDQTFVTGWGTNDVTQIPKYHGQYSRFRGYVFFESQEPDLLPWNTTKTNVDIDSPLYQAIRVQMIRLARPVIDFLNKIHQERQNSRQEESERPLGSTLASAKKVSLQSVATAVRFVAPKPPVQTRTTPARSWRISYSKSIEDIQKVKSCLGVSKNEEVGEKTFEYYFKMECDGK